MFLKKKLFINNIWVVRKMIDEQDFNNWRGEVDDSLYLLEEEIKKLDARLKLLEKNSNR
jgi:hypothetical protein